MEVNHILDQIQYCRQRCTDMYCMFLENSALACPSTSKHVSRSTVLKQHRLILDVGCATVGWKYFHNYQVVMSQSVQLSQCSLGEDAIYDYTVEGQAMSPAVL